MTANRKDAAPDLADAPTLAASLSATMSADVRAVGLSLTRLREARGWTLAEVSVRLKFSERQLAALEAERWADLPHGLPLRGLVRNYARLLELDPEALLTALEPQLDARQAGRAQLGVSSSSQLASERAAHLMSQASDHRRRIVWLVGAAVLIGLAALVAVITYAPGGWSAAGAH